MRSRRFISALLLALGVSAVFTLMLGRRVQHAHASPVAAAATLHYVVLKKDVQAGEVLDAHALTIAPWPGASALAGAFTSIADVAGRVVLYPLAAGQPILSQQLAGTGSGPGLPYKIPAGMRAVSVKCNDVTGVSGFVLPGMHVDAMVTYRNVADKTARTLLLLENAQVLAVGQKMDADPQGKPVSADVVTLLLTPAAAERTVQAMAEGEVYFSLRNGADRGASPSVPSTVAPRTTPRVAQPLVNQSYKVDIANGDKQHTETFE